jgi:hypothetical protein
MFASHEENDSRQVNSTSTADSGGSTPELPCIELSEAAPTAERCSNEDAVIRPLSELVLEETPEFIVDLDDETVELRASPFIELAPLLEHHEPLTWLFAGARLSGDAAFGDGRLIGEWFAEEWRAESGRSTDLVIDATWPECTLTALKSHLKSRVVRHRPNIAFLVLDRSDASGGIAQLPHFERRLVAVLSVLSEIGTTTVLLQTPLTGSDDIDAEIYFEAISGIARERDIAHLELPAPGPTARGSRTPESPARNAALYLCRELMRTR